MARCLKPSQPVGSRKDLGNFCSERQRDLTIHPADAGANPRTASVWAAVKSLVNRTIAADGGVRLLEIAKRSSTAEVL